jgi:hypothetical protein
MEPDLRVHDGILQTVVFIGLAGTVPFMPIGTGFITLKMADESSDLGWQTIVTARHVIDKIPGDQVYIRLNNKQGEAEVISVPKARWWNHPDGRVDVSVCPTKLPKDQFGIVHLFLDKLILDDESMAQYSVGIGDDVYFPGMFVPRLGERKNIPILRSGTITAIAGEKIRTQYGYHQAHLIEARSTDLAVRQSA